MDTFRKKSERKKVNESTKKDRKMDGCKDVIYLV
jgi:hypothetical protein